MYISGFGYFSERPHVYYNFSLQRTIQKECGITTGISTTLSVERDLRQSIFTDFKSKNFIGFYGFDNIQTELAFVCDQDRDQICFSVKEIIFERPDYASEGLFAWLRRISQGWLPYFSPWKIEWKFTRILS
jgi:hypothetical protein